MGVDLLLLLGQVVLDLLHVQQLRAEFESEWKFVAEDLSIALDLSSVPGLELTQSLSILFLGLKQILVPLLVKLLVLLDVCLLALFTLLRLIEDELLVSAIVVLLLQLSNSILSHLGLNILSFALTCVSVILQHLTFKFKCRVSICCLNAMMNMSQLLHLFDYHII